MYIRARVEVPCIFDSVAAHFAVVEGSDAGKLESSLRFFAGEEEEAYNLMVRAVLRLAALRLQGGS